jgi:hypothetical protein
VDAAAVKEELRQEFREAAVRKIQQPGGVRDRVKQWQKTNAAAIKSGVAFQPEVVDDVASEPTEILVNLDDKESVTEEDRLRIRTRQKPKKRKSKPAAETGQAEGEDNHDDEEGEGVVIHQENPPKPRPLPKKRIISDSHWMKQGKGKSPPRGKSPKAKDETSLAPIPKDFLQKTARNPPVQEKIKDWAQKVEIPEAAPSKVKKYQTKMGDTITIEVEGSNASGSTSRPPKTEETFDHVGHVESKPKSQNHDGIRVKPIRVKRVRPRQSPPSEQDIQGKSVDEATVRSEPSVPSNQGSGRTPGRRSGHRPEGTTAERLEPASEGETPTRRNTSGRRKTKRRTPSPPTTATQTTTTDEASDVKSHVDKSDQETSLSESELRSDLPSIAPGSKKLADIPVGYSAFSELDLPLGADARNSVKRSQRPKQERNGSFKAIPKVLKKVVTEGKKILHEQVVEAPRVAGINQPPSIETWLNTTVDPFVDAPKPKEKVEKEWVKATRRRSSSEHGPAGTQQHETERSKSRERQEEIDRAETAKDVESDATPKKVARTPTSGSAGLKRRGATRAPSSPTKPAARKPFKEQLKDAFRGESGGHKLIPVVVYPSVEVDEYSQVDVDGSDYDRRHLRRSSSGSSRRSRSRSPTEHTTSVDSASSIDPGPAANTGLPRRKPPTSGFHELSTIVSEVSGVSCSTCPSDTISAVSQSTITQEHSTLTRSTDLSRGSTRRSNKSSGLKRRLTKHSDLVSVLSLPDNGQLQPANRTRSVRSGGRLLRKTSKLLDNTPIDDLLEEFADDEYYYQRELKTLVDGVVPVLLTQFVNGSTNEASREQREPTSKGRDEDAMSEAIVGMGMALEKLKDLHRRVPVSDIHAVLLWLDSVYPIYDNYLDVWRLGFQDLIVNLAPAAGKPEDQDSLVNAMPRNEDGDVLDETGEPVDVAHLLKRPLIRIKWMVKLVKVSFCLILNAAVLQIARY